MNRLFLNDVFLLNGNRYRVVHIQPGRKLYGFPIDETNGLPVGWDIEEINAFAQSKLTLVDAPDVQKPMHSSRLSQEVAARRWSDVRSLVEGNPLELMERATRAKAISRHCDQTGKSDRYVMNLLRLLWRFGVNKSSLAADFSNCGRISPESVGAVVIEAHPPTGPQLIVFAPSTQRARGRRPIYSDYEPYSYPPKFKEQLIEEIRAKYLKDETVTLRAVQDHVMTRYFCKVDAKGCVVRHEDGRPRMLPAGKRPSNEQIKYLIKKSVPIHEAFAKRVGDAPYRNDVAKSDGTVHDDCVGPGDVYEIDATIVDLWLTSRYHRSVIVGKATLYLIVDRGSDLIVGFYLTLRKASWEGAKRAILSISSDWKALCEAAGVKYRETDWPAHRVYPNRFFADQGEVASQKSDVVSDIAGIEVSAAPGASPRRKSRVEGSIAMIHVPIKDHIGGYEPQKNVKKRLGKKYSKDARYSLDEMVKPFLLAIIKHNHTVRENAVLHPGLVYQGFQATPINIWNHNIEHSMGRASRHDFEYMRQRLLPTDKGEVTQSGISFNGLLYSFHSPRYDVLLAYAGRGVKTELIVQYDPARAGEIWVSERKTPDVTYKASLTSKYKPLEELSLEEVAHYLQSSQALSRDGAVVNQELRIGYAMDVDEYDRELKDRTASASRGIPMGTRIRVGQQARVLEAEEREREHLSSQTAATVAVQGYRPPALEEPVDSSDDEHPSVQDEVLEEQHPDSREASASDGRPATDTRAMPVANKTSSEQLLTNLLGLMDDELER